MQPINAQELFSLEGRTALVTGGSRGIGLMIATGFLEQGAKVYISGRDRELCNSIAAELLSVGDCVALPGDISTLEGINTLVSELEERETALDILVNSAGLAYEASLEDFTEAGWDDVLSVNAKAPFFLTQQLLPLLTPKDERPAAKVINIASIDGIALYQGNTYSYHASKAALIHLTKRMSIDLAQRGIIVNAIAPGAFPSEMNQEARDNADRIAAIVPAGRVGTIKDMAAAAIYLASHGGDYVVGTTLVVDGGLINSRGVRIRR